MFIRWKRKACAPKKDWEDGKRVYITDHLLYAQLVQSFRENGKPRQCVIAHLGSIRESKMDRARPRSWFWDKANEQLKKLDLDQIDLLVLIESLEKRIPIPTEVELENALSELKAIMGSFK